MKYVYEFTVDPKPRGIPTGDARVLTRRLFTKLRDRYYPSLTEVANFPVRVTQEEALTSSLFEAIEADGGKRPLADSYYASFYPDSYFPVRVERILEASELEQSPWLYLTVPKLSMAELKGIGIDGSYIIKKVTNRKKVAFGCTRTAGWMLLFSAKLKDAFLAENLNAVEFRPVKLENGDESGLWQLWSDIVMPPLSMKLLTSRREPFEGDPMRGCMIDDGDYTWPVLKYREQDIKKLPNVDVALTAEWFGPGGHHKNRFYVVSQRFRQVAERLAPGQFSYGMVAVGEGEELENRYRIPELDPPKD